MTLRDSNGESVIKAILRGVSVPDESTSLSPSAQNSLETLRNYAQITKGSNDLAKFAAEAHAFHELIFVSAYEVLGFAGFNVDSVNDAERLYLTNSKDIHLYRLRKGAQWVSEQISTLDA